MILELKKIFLNENESLSVKTELDMSGDTIGRSAVPGKVAADVNVSNHAGMVVFEADVRFRCHCVCDRCCEPFDKDFAYTLSHILVTKLPEDSGDDYIEAPDYTLDTDALLRDDILLEFPSKFLCKDSCKGLCPKCGKNLNEGECCCVKQEGHPAFAALSELLEE